MNRPLRTRTVGGVGPGARNLWLPDWASLAERDHEFFWRDLGLTQKTCECSDLDLAMHRDNATSRFALHDNVASTLPEFLKSQPFECALNFGTRDVRKFRHVPVQVR